MTRPEEDTVPIFDGEMLAQLRSSAEAARSLAYAPYSEFCVGAAVAMSEGQRCVGVNIENASYGLTICAERVAIQSAIAQGARLLRAIAIAGPPDTLTAPCGACRQVIAEFGTSTTLISFRGPQGWCDASLADLLPQRFHLS